MPEPAPEPLEQDNGCPDLTILQPVQPAIVHPALNGAASKAAVLLCEGVQGNIIHIVHILHIIHIVYIMYILHMLQFGITYRFFY